MSPPHIAFLMSAWTGSLGYLNKKWSVEGKHFSIGQAVPYSFRTYWSVCDDALDTIAFSTASLTFNADQQEREATLFIASTTP